MSAVFEGRYVWLFGDTLFRPGGSPETALVSNSWCWTLDFDASDGLDLFHPLGAGTSPLSLLRLDEAELRFNDEHARKECPTAPCGVAWALWPSALVPDPIRSRALIFYGKLLVGPGVLEFSRVEHSIAVWENWESPAVRLPTERAPVTFKEGETLFGSAAVAERDWLYVYGCGGADPCRLARVPLANTLDRGYWQYYAGSGDWTAEIGNAVPIFEANGILSVAYNEYASAYVAVYAPPLSNQVVMRTAPRPEGPWSKPIEAFATETPSYLWVYDAHAHSELDRDAGRILYVTYTLVTGEQTSKMLLVEVELDRD